jgi:hypothetical protein
MKKYKVGVTYLTIESIAIGVSIFSRGVVVLELLAIILSLYVCKRYYIEMQYQKILFISSILLIGCIISIFLSEVGRERFDSARLLVILLEYLVKTISNNPLLASVIGVGAATQVLHMDTGELFKPLLILAACVGLATLLGLTFKYFIARQAKNV